MLNLHFPMVFPWFSCFPMVFPWFFLRFSYESPWKKSSKTSPAPGYARAKSFSHGLGRVASDSSDDAAVSAAPVERHRTAPAPTAATGREPAIQAAAPGQGMTTFLLGIFFPEKMEELLGNQLFPSLKWMKHDETSCFSNGRHHCWRHLEGWRVVSMISMAGLVYFLWGIHIYLPTYIRTYLPTYMHACMHIYIYTYTFTHLYDKWYGETSWVIFCRNLTKKWWISKRLDNWVL